MTEGASSMMEEEVLENLMRYYFARGFHGSSKFCHYWKSFVVTGKSFVTTQKNFVMDKKRILSWIKKKITDKKEFCHE